MKKLFSVTFEIRLLVAAYSERDARGVALDTLSHGRCADEVRHADWAAAEITAPEQLSPSERGSLPWDRRSYERLESEDVTCEEILRRLASAGSER